MELKSFSVILPLLMYVVGTSALQYSQRLSDPYVTQIGGSCSRLETRYQQIRQEVIEFCETVETRIDTYDDVFVQSSKSGGFLCGVQSALEDLKSVLQSSRSPSSTWIFRIDTLLSQFTGYCTTFTTRTVEVERISTSIVTIQQQVREVREFVQTIDISSCDRRAESLLDQCSSRLGQLKNVCNSHWGEVGTFLGGPRGRAYDGTTIGRDSYSGNVANINICDSYLEGVKFDLFNKFESTTTNNHYNPHAA